MKTGPAIEALMRRLAETPGEFLAEPKFVSRDGGAVYTEAVVFDVMTDLGVTLDADTIAVFATREPSKRNWLRLVLVAMWLLHDESLRNVDPDAVLDWLQNDLTELARLVEADQFVADQDRREELGRVLLARVGMTPAGETAEQAADRLTTVDSLARARVLAQTRAKRERAEQLRQEMEKKRARDAAARYSRE